MKFPFLRSLGPEEGWYKVGPLARVQNCDRINTPLADAARREFLDYGGGRPVHSPLAYHWTRMIEMLFAAEVIKDLLHDDDLLGTDLVSCGDRAERGVGVIEAPRGTLIHHYRVDEHDQITRANLIVSTTHNNQAMNEAIRQVARTYSTGARSPSRCSITSRSPSAPSIPACRARLMRSGRCAGGRTRRCLRCHGRPAGQGRRVADMLSLQPPPDAAPVLVLAVGNPSRGDDALGPLAAQRLAALELSGVEVLTDFQLQVEHALDLLAAACGVHRCHRIGRCAVRAACDPARARHVPQHAQPVAGGGPGCLSAAHSREPPPARLLAIRAMPSNWARR